MEDPSIIYRVAVAPSRQLLREVLPLWYRRFDEGPVIGTAFDDSVHDTRHLGGNCCERFALEIWIVSISSDIALVFISEAIVTLADRDLAGDPERSA